MNEATLPNGWAISTIGDLIGSQGIFRDGDWVESKDQDQNGQVRLIQLADIGDGEFRDKSSRFLTTDKTGELNCTFLQTGDILVARMPDPLGRACIFPLHGNNKFVTVVDVCVIRFGSDIIDARYFMYALNSPMSRRKISDHQTGSTRKRISRGNLSTVQFPIAPLNEQHRIVAKIEELFSELDKGIENLKTARAQLKVYRQALLKHAFEGKLTAQWRAENQDKLETADTLLQRIQQERAQRYQQQLADWQTNGGSKPKALKSLPPLTAAELAELPELPEGWGWVRLASIVSIISGYAFRSSDFISIGVPVVKIANVGYSEFVDKDQEYLDSHFLQSQKDFLISPDDFLLALTRPITNNRTKVCRYPKNVPVALLNQRVSAMKNVEINPEFLYSYFATSFFKESIRSKFSETLQPNLSPKDLEACPIPICSLVEQELIFNDIEARLSEVDQLELTITTSLQQAEALRQSILKKAFSGQLVPQDPHDEPASKLLARIKAENMRHTEKPKKSISRAMQND